MVDTKAWYASKTIWVAALVVALGIVQSITGQTVSPAETTTILGFIFLILRLVTNNQINLNSNDTTTIPIA
jgi:hypothetical protein